MASLENQRSKEDCNSKSVLAFAANSQRTLKDKSYVQGRLQHVLVYQRAPKADY